MITNSFSKIVIRTQASYNRVKIALDQILYRKFPIQNRIKQLKVKIHRFQIQDRKKYDPEIPGWVNVYVVLHFLIVFLAFDDLGRYNVVSFFC